MKKISTEWSSWLEKYSTTKGSSQAPGPRFHALVVGSGYGGCVAARRLTEAGFKVTILERGSEYLPGDFPNDFSQLPAHFRVAGAAAGKGLLGLANGVFEMRYGPGVTSVVANGVGGGSLINAGVMMTPDPDVFAQDAWPEALRFHPHQLDEYFEEARKSLHTHDALPRGESKKSEAFHRLGTRLGGKYSKAQVTIDPKHCTSCGDCCSGCNVPGAKITLRDSYLKPVLKDLQILSSATVYSLDRSDIDAGDEAGRKPCWRLRVLPTEKISFFQNLKEAAEDDETGINVYADVVVLAAGTFGSTEILQRSKSSAGDQLRLSPALGNRFSGNGDSLTFSANENQRVNAVGVGAEAWRSFHSEYRDIGPTISRVLDRRGADAITAVEPDVPAASVDASHGSRATQRLPLRERLVIQDGSIPGAIAPAAISMLTFAAVTSQLGAKDWQYPRDRQSDHLAMTPWLDSNPKSLGQTTQVLLAMGHDESKGRLVWDSMRNQTFPYWVNPAELPTFKTRRSVLRNAIRANRAQWIPNLLEVPLPRRFRDILGGESIPSFMTTVHPLGGCVMGDAPNLSVVDEFCRVWELEDESGKSNNDETWFGSLFVCDGSIMPTSLGCNPSLTISALVERAFNAERLKDLLAEFPGFVREQELICNHREYSPQPLTRSEAPRMEGYLEERLYTRALKIDAGYQELFGGEFHSADLNLQLYASDWQRMWGDSKHKLAVHGTARFSASNQIDSAASWVSYKVVPELSSAELFSSGYQYRRYSKWRLDVRIVRFYNAVKVWITYYLTSKRDIKSASKRKFWTKMTFVRLWYRWAKSAGEVRKMRYQLVLEPTGIGVDDSSSEFPRLRLHGTKRISVAASTWKIVRTWLSLTRPRKQEIRETLVEQASHLDVRLFVDRGPAREPAPFAKDRFLMDFSDMTERLPLRLVSGGDLPTALGLFLEYPSVFARYLIKAALFDFRLPDYSGVQVIDSFGPKEVGLRSAGGDLLLPDIHELTVPTTDRVIADTDSAKDSKKEKTTTLKLLRYRRPESEGGKPQIRDSSWQGLPVRKAKSVLLLHAFSQSGYSFTLNTIDTNLAESLYSEGYEVWILEHRLSTRLPAHQEQSTLDQIASADVPVAVDTILELIDSEEPGRDGERNPLQIFAFGQCLGAASMSISILKGALTYQEQVDDSASALPMYLPKLAGFISSQTHPHCVAQPAVRAKYWVPAAARDVAQLACIPFATRSAEPSFAENMLDRFLSSLPVPEDEFCPDRKHHVDEDDCATCRRIRFIEAPLFKHRNLNYKTHRDLPLLFGDANVSVFAHAAKVAEAERLVTEDGDNIYVTDANFRAYMGLPVVFMHGSENELFDSEGAAYSAAQYARTQPVWSNRVARQIGSRDSQMILEGYGHVDVLIGENASREVFPRLGKALTQWFDADFETHSDPIGQTRVAGKAQVRLHLPLVGPILGAVEKQADGLSAALSFCIDDRFSGGNPGGQENGLHTWAFARVRALGASDWGHMQLVDIITQPDGSSDGADTHQRIAAGVVELGPDVQDYEIQCASLHEVLGEYPVGRSATIEVTANATPTEHSIPVPSGELEESLTVLFDGIKQMLAEFQSSSGPVRRTASRHRLYAEKYESSIASLNAPSIEAFVGSNDCASQISIGVGSCRYPGFRIEHRRVDRWIDPIQNKLQFALLLGDQIYADATAGVADELSPVERYFSKHRYAFKKSTYGESDRTLGDWLSTLPVFMLPDDHEFCDAYPDGPPLATVDRSSSAEVQKMMVSVARKALIGFQQQQMNSVAVRHVDEGAWQFRAGAARFLLLDTRTYRKKLIDSAEDAILSRNQKDFLRSWLREAEANQFLNVIATGSVVLPGLIEGSTPSNPGRLDNFQASPKEREYVLDEVEAAYKHHSCRRGEGRFRFLLVSGDYHLTTAFQIERDNEVIGGVVTSPPLYSPMPFLNTSASSLFTEEQLPHNWKMTKVGDGSWEGNGMGVLNIRQNTDSDVAFSISYSGELWIPDQFESPASMCKFEVALEL